MENSVEILKRKHQEVLEGWIKYQSQDAGLREMLITSEDLRIQSEDLLSAIINNITEENLSDIDSLDFAPVRDQLAAISYSRAKQGYSPRETATFIFTLKDAINEILTREISDAKELNEQTLLINKLIDGFGIDTFETYLKGREEVILRQTDEIQEISTPVIKVWDGILALPIIGTLDSSRTQMVMESLLQEIVDSGSTVAILDISGVPAVDSLVAQHLIKTVSATRLMGAECIISGIRPEIAQTVVHLGIDLSDIITKSTLASALKSALTLLNKTKQSSTLSN